MRSSAPVIIAKISYIVISIALLLFGAFLIIEPGISMAVFGIFIGVALILFGAAKIVGYLSKDLYQLAFQFDLASGFLAIALGLMILLEPNRVIDTVCIAMGISFLMDGLLKIQISIDGKRFGIQQWWLILSAAILTAAIGIMLVFRTAESAQAIMVLFGLSLMAEGMLNLITVLTTVKVIHYQCPPVIVDDTL